MKSKIERLTEAIKGLTKVIRERTGIQREMLNTHVALGQYTTTLFVPFGDDAND